MRRNRSTLVARLAMGLWVFGALALVAGCALPVAPTTQATSATPLATANLPPQATSKPAPAEPPTQTPWLRRLPAGTIALYGVGSRQGLDLYALGADGATTGLGVRLAPGSLASHDGRWVVHLDAPQPEARAVVIRSLQDGRQSTIPLGVDCGQENCIVGLWAFDREGARLASVEVAVDRWAVVVADLRDGSSRRFEATRAQGEAYPVSPGTPLGWAATGELILDTFRPFSEGAYAGVWAIALPAGGSSTAIAALGPRQLLAVGAYLSRPQLSPDGTRLLYLARDREYTPAGYTLHGGFEDVAVNQLWSLDVAGGQATRLVEVTDGGALASAVAWSPDGRSVLFAEGRYADGQRLSELTLKAVSAAGAVREIGALPARSQLRDLRWCRPGLALATTYGSSGVGDLLRVDLASGRTAFVAKGQRVSVLGILPVGAGEAIGPSLTPCPSRPIALPEPARFTPVEDARGAIARSTPGGGFSLVFPDTGAVLYIHTLVPWCGQQVREADRGLAWSPDGRHIAFVYSLYGPPQEEQTGYLMLADLERGEVRPLLQDGGVFGRPAWSPDGERLAFVRYAGRGWLNVLDLSSGVVSVIGDDAVFTPWLAPVWTDDGRVAYSRTAGRNGAQSELVSQGLDGSAPHVIAQGSRLFAASPDRRQMAYNWGSEILLMDTDSGAEELLDTMRDVLSLQWSPCGRYLLAHAAPTTILLSQAGPAGPLQPVKAAGVPGQQAWSPDGRRFGFIMSSDDRETRPTLAIYDVQGGAVNALGVTVGMPFEVVWSPQ